MCVSYNGGFGCVSQCLRAIVGLSVYGLRIVTVVSGCGPWVVGLWVAMLVGRLVFNLSTGQQSVENFPGYCPSLTY